MTLITDHATLSNMDIDRLYVKVHDSSGTSMDKPLYCHGIMARYSSSHDHKIRRKKLHDELWRHANHPKLQDRLRPRRTLYVIIHVSI